MLPEMWQSVNRLLLCAFDESKLPEYLDSVQQVLNCTMPGITIWVLLLQGESYALREVNTSLKQVPQVFTFIPESNFKRLIEVVKAHSFDAAMILTVPGQSPFLLGYLCYLAGIPIRLGQSCEFGGGVLSPCVKPPMEHVSPVVYHLHLLQSAGFPVPELRALAIA